MKKLGNKGFMLVETLIATIFVAGILIFIYIQFTNLNKLYNKSYAYNTVPDLYALEDVISYINSDTTILNYISSNIQAKGYLDITDCNNFTMREYCVSLFDIENIDQIIVTTNDFDKSIFDNLDEKFKEFISKISPEGYEEYRVLARFKDLTYATLRFGDNYE